MSRERLRPVWPLTEERTQIRKEPTEQRGGESRHRVRTRELEEEWRSLFPGDDLMDWGLRGRVVYDRPLDVATKSGERNAERRVLEAERGGSRSPTIPDNGYPYPTLARASSRYNERLLLSPQFQTTWNRYTTTDTTIHFELNIEEDFEGQFEEFHRLRRLGNFKAAEQYFQDHLLDSVDHPLVKAEYAEMLLQQGAYERVDELLQDRIPSRKPPRTVGGLTQANLRLILASAKMDSFGWYKKALTEVREPSLREHMLKRSDYPKLTSTEIRILTHLFYIMSRAEDSTNFLKPNEIENTWYDWKGLYGLLLEDGRIWDVRDILAASISAFQPLKTWLNFFDEDVYSADFFDKFLDDWTSEGYDESTYLAILDILIILSRSFISQLCISKRNNTISVAKHCLEHARIFASAIRQNDPQNIKSRPYIRWILAEEELARHMVEIEKGNFSNEPAFSRKYFEKFPGITRWNCTPAIYVPSLSENPGWHVSKELENSNELLKVALKASQELEDYETESACLKELICRSQEPKDLFSRLNFLQKSVQGNELGYLETCLAKYLLVMDEKSCQALESELAEFDGQQVTSCTIGDPSLLWCQRMVQSALYRSLGKFPAKSGFAPSKSEFLANDLPSCVQDQISKLDLLNNVWKNRDIESHDAPNSSTNSKQETALRERKHDSPTQSRRAIRPARSTPSRTQVDGVGAPEQSLKDDKRAHSQQVVRPREIPIRGSYYYPEDPDVGDSATEVLIPETRLTDGAEVIVHSPYENMSRQKTTEEQRLRDSRSPSPSPEEVEQTNLDQVTEGQAEPEHLNSDNSEAARVEDSEGPFIKDGEGPFVEEVD